MIADLSRRNASPARRADEPTWNNTTHSRSDLARRANQKLFLRSANFFSCSCRLIGSYNTAAPSRSHLAIGESVILAEPKPTPYDWRFNLLGFPVCVTPWFWLVTLVLGYGLWESMPYYLEQMRAHQEAGVIAPPDLAAFHPGLSLLLWLIAVFVSILVHELGHAAAMRWYGMDASIVLYHFGGLAIPGVWSRWDRPTTRVGNVEQIVISAAGPFAQLLLACLVFGLLRATGHYAQTFFGPADAILPYGPNAPLLGSLPLQALAIYILWPSIAWAVLNLAPVYPLDGGQIARHALVLWNPWQGQRISLMVSIAAAAGLAVYGFLNQNHLLGFMFLSLAASSWQMLQMQDGRGGSQPW